MINIKYGQYPLLFLNTLIICYITGIYMASIITLPYKYLFLLLLVNFLIAFYTAFYKKAYTFLFVLILFFIIGLLKGNTAFILPENNISHYENDTITIKGQICEIPSIKKDIQGLYHLTYIVDTKQIIADDNTKIVSGKIYLYKKQSTLDNIADINDTICITGTIYLINSYHNYGLANRELTARQEGIYAFLSANKAPINIINNDNSFSIKRFCFNIQKYILSILYKAMPQNDANMIFAMLFGGYNDIDSKILEAFSITGIIHILSVSGSHISLLIGFILNFTKLFKTPRIVSLVIVFFIVIFYAVLCGANAPIIRATIMGLLSLIALNLNKMANACHLLSITALILLFLEPLLCFNISFQLSFASTVGLVYIMDKLKNKISFLPRFLKDNIALTLSAQIATLPIIIWYFNAISLSSILANIIILPFLEIIIILGLLGVIFSFIIPFLAHFIFIISSLILGLSTTLTMILTKIPFASIYLPTIPFSLAVFYYIMLFSLLNDITLNIIKRFFKFIILFLIIIICINLYLSTKEQLLQIHFIDVGQGDACLIITPNKYSIMIDTGGTINSDFDIGSRIDLPYLRHYGITKLDYLILSHSDNDHSGGASSILEKIPVKHLIISNENIDNYAKNLKISKDNHLLKNAIVFNDKLCINIDDVNLQFLSTNYNKQTNSSNESSLVIKLTYHNFSTLFTGDISSTQENNLINSNYNLKSTVLKVAHHGSKTSSSVNFLKMVKPIYAIISVGKYNYFGLPNKEVLDRLNQLNTTILRTDIHGAIIFFTDGYTLKVKSFN